MSRKWSAEELAYLREHYPTTDTKILAEHFGRSVSCVSSTAGHRGIKKAKGFERPTVYTHLCWTCQNACNSRKCEWVRNFTEVEGWKKKKKKGGTFDVIYCPKYKKDVPRVQEESD